MKKCHRIIEADFRIKFVTRDGSVVMNRVSDRDWYFMANGTVNEGYMKLALEVNARHKGVRVVSHEVHENEVVAVVEWL